MKDEFDRRFNTMFKAILAMWIVGGILSLSLVGAIIYAIIRFVQAYA